MGEPGGARTTGGGRQGFSVRLRTGASVGVLAAGGAGAAAPLVLVPGVGGAKELFAGLLPRLAADRRAYAVDLSPRVARGAGVLDSAAADLDEVLDALALERADLLGQSFGAVVAVRAWRVRPGRLRRLVLAAPATAPAGPAGAWTFLRWTALGSAVRLWPASRRRSLAALVRRCGGYPIEPELTGGDFDALVDRVKGLAVRALARRLAALVGHSWRRELAGVDAPLLIVEGDREAALLPRGVLELFRTRAGTRLVTVAGGHMPFLTRPGEFARAVLGFLDAP
jgi:pimeloyl-ACP methyl ester carboxylesterase